MSSTAVEVFRAYLLRVRELSATLPDDRARRLADELGRHLQQAQRAEQLDEWGAHLVLEKLGTPEELVARTASSPLVEGQPIWFHPAPTLKVEKLTVTLLAIGLLTFWVPPISLVLLVAGGIGVALSKVWSPGLKIAGLLGPAGFLPGLLALRYAVVSGLLPAQVAPMLSVVVLVWAVAALWVLYLLFSVLRGRRR